MMPTFRVMGGSPFSRPDFASESSDDTTDAPRPQHEAMRRKALERLPPLLVADV
jgi:hypothetical protein